MPTENELLNIELRNKGNEDVEWLLVMIKDLKAELEAERSERQKLEYD